MVSTVWNFSFPRNDRSFITKHLSSVCKLSRNVYCTSLFFSWLFSFDFKLNDKFFHAASINLNQLHLPPVMLPSFLSKWTVLLAHAKQTLLSHCCQASTATHTQSVERRVIAHKHFNFMHRLLKAFAIFWQSTFFRSRLGLLIFIFRNI